ncbi:MAG: aminoglycoside phosphotransferase [Alphaproteobacteria bacterium]|nr:MAG: aminoglycoside phosphotransferase [Alphaproteobacteria bacterium]
MSAAGSGRAAAIGAFLAAAGAGGRRPVPLAGDASPRRYYRVPGAPSLVLMDAPPGSGEDVRPFLAMARWLRAQGFSAPEVLAADAEAGLVLLEDLGDDLFARVMARDPATERPLLTAAVELLAALAELPPPPFLAPYDLEALLAEARLVIEWYLPAASGRPVPPDLAAEFDALIAAATAEVRAERAPVAVLRDYHAENLIWLPERRGHARVGLLDFQDARAGHPAYDLVSLIEDARRDTSPGLAELLIDRHAALTGAEPGVLRAACAALGAQRNLKILGIFARLAIRDGKPRYLDLLPRVWGHVMTDLAHPDLAALARFVRAHLPAPESGVIARIRARTGTGVAA